MKKLIATLVLGLSAFASAFAATKVVTVTYFEGGPCDTFCATEVEGRCLSGCTISYNANGQVTSVTCNYSACGGGTRPRIVTPGTEN